MVRLFERLKLNRVLAWLLVVCTVMSTFITSISSVEVSAAGANERLVASINIGGGQTLSTVGASQNIDEASLQVIALYLSNYYIPFVTILDGDYTYEEAEDTGNKAHVQAMQNALINNCGMSRQTADFVTNYVLGESLGTCTPLYVKTSDLEELFELWESTDKLDDDSEVTHTNAGAYYIDELELDYDKDGSPKLSEDRGSMHREDSTLFYTDIDDYIDYFGEVSCKVGSSTEWYVPVTYPIFLNFMQWGIYHNTNWDGEYDLSSHKFEHNTKWSTQKRVNFYYRDSGNNFNIVFSNSIECLQSLLLVTSEINANKGYGTALSFVGEDDVDAIDDSDISIKGISYGSQMYVNWEGSLIVDTGMYRTPVVPGCANPHMLTIIGETNEDAYTTPLQNLFAIASYLYGYSEGDNLAYSDEDNSFSRIEKWRVQCGTNVTVLDSVGSGSWGDAQYIHDLVDSSTFMIAKKGKANCADEQTFPNFSNLGDWVYSSGDYNRWESSMDGIGSPVLNSSLVYYDNFEPINSSTDLNDIFSPFEINDAGFKDKYSVLNMDIYASFKNITKLGTEGVYTSVPQNLGRCLYWTYCFAKFNEDKNPDAYVDTEHIVNLRLNTAAFPTFNSGIDWSTLYADSLSDQVLSFAYYILHPTEGINYVATLLKNKVGGFLLRCHDDMVGSTDSNSSTGMTKYLSTSSYVSTSGLYDVEWIANLLSIYDSLIVYMIILMCLVLLCYIIVGSMTLSRGLIGVLMFALLAFIPPFAINSTVNIINTFTDKVYSEKFDYWAITQLENYLYTLDSSAALKDAGDYSSYAAFVVSQYTVASDSVGGSVSTTYGGTKLKWLSPKKYNSMAMMSKIMDSTVSSTDATFLVNSMFSSLAQATSGETYLDSDNALYLYRDYTDIYRASAYSYYVESIYNYSGALKDGKNSTTGKEDNKPLLMSTINSGDYYSYAYSFKNLSNGNKNLHNLVLHDIERSSSSVSSSTNAYDLLSSTNAVNLGFLNDTSTNNNGTNIYYLHSYNLSNNTFAVSYLLNYNHVYRYTCDALAKLKDVSTGSSKININSPVASVDGNNGWNFGSYYGAEQENFYNLGTAEIMGLNTETLSNAGGSSTVFNSLSSYFYGLYSESPMYFFTNNIRDHLHSTKVGGGYSFNESNLANASDGGKTSQFAKMLLEDNQKYFYNYSNNAGDGYGEMRDFMNMHDLFYYVIPSLKPGVDLARLYDETFGLYMDDDLALSFSETGKFTFEGNPYNSVEEFTKKDAYKNLSDELKYKFWHSYNTFTILQNYTSWLDLMMDCNYANPETISIMGDKFRVENPLDPFSYVKIDSSTNEIVEGRPMIFSRSEMAYYGLTEADLTTVEQKIIDLQDNVYAATLDLMNYNTLSDETLITSFGLIQLFEFNKIFSQDSLVGESFTLYPQGYELKGFSYDAYLRMIIAESSGESIMTGGGTDANGNAVENSSIYKRVLENTSLFFALFLLINDILAVYLIPGLKLFFIVCIFITSVLIIIGSAIKMELNMFKVMWQSLFAPLLSFAGISMGMSLLVSMFMGDGANGVVQSSATIDLGDPTATIIVMIIINAGVTILYFKVCKKCFHDLKTYGKAIFDNIGSTVVGAVGTVTSAISRGSARDRLLRRGGGSGSGSKVANTAKQRGQDNMPSSGKTGVGTGALGGAVGAGMASDLLSNSEKGQAKTDALRRDASLGMNKYDKAAYEGANKRSDDMLNKAVHNDELASKARGLNKKRLQTASALQFKRAEAHENYAKNVAEHGKLRAGFMQAGYHGKNVGSSLKSGAYKVKSGVGRIGSTLTNAQTYANLGAGVASIGNQRREFNNRVVTGAKKGANAVKNAPRAVVNTAKGAVNAVKNTPQAVKSTAKNTAVRINNKKNQGIQFAKRMGRAASSGYNFTTNKARK